MTAKKPVTIAARRVSTFMAMLRRRGTRKHLAEFFFFSVSFAALTGGLGLYLEHQFHYEVQTAGLIFGFSGLIGAIVQGGLLRRLVKKFGEERLVAAGLVSMLLGYCFLGVTFALGPLLLLVVLGSFGAAVVRPSVTTLITRSVAQEDQGGALGVSQSLGSIAQMSGPAAATWLIGRDQIVLYGLLCAALSLVGLLFAIKRSDDTSPLPRAEIKNPKEA